MYSRFIGWFDARSQVTKLALIFLAVVALPLSLLLSPLLSVVAIVVLGISIVMLLVRRRSGGPMMNWGIVAGVSLVFVFAFGGVSEAIYGDESTEQATKESQEEPSERTTEEPKPVGQGDPEKSSQVEEESTAQEASGDNTDQAAVPDQEEPDSDSKEPANESPKAPQPQPQSVDERIVSVVKKAAYLRTETTAIQRAGAGCYDVAVRFNENPMEDIEWLMEDIYAGLYNDPQLEGEVCNVAVNAFGDIKTVGQKGWHKEKVYSTSLDAATAKTANWKKDAGVNTYSANNLKQVWTAHFIHPAIRQAKKQEQARDRLKRELDCMYDEGIFDVDALCP